MQTCAGQGDRTLGKRAVCEDRAWRAEKGRGCKTNAERGTGEEQRRERRRSKGQAPCTERLPRTIAANTIRGCGVSKGWGGDRRNTGKECGN
eukprot:754041-Hanusia_phi.AAC.3